MLPIALVLFLLMFPFVNCRYLLQSNQTIINMKQICWRLSHEINNQNTENLYDVILTGLFYLVWFNFYKSFIMHRS